MTIGAATTQPKSRRSAELKKTAPAVAELAGMIGDPHVRHRGTIGGSVANNDPAADYPSALLALGATVVTNSREIAADDFFTGLFETALEDGEIITAIRFEAPEKAAYEKFRNPASRYAIAGVFVARTGLACRGDGARERRLPPGRHGGRAGQNFAPRRWKGFCRPTGDERHHASFEYRANLVKVMGRAWN